MQKYESVKIEWISFSKSEDIICTSGEGTVEDNYDWLE